MRLLAEEGPWGAALPTGGVLPQLARRWLRLAAAGAVFDIPHRDAGAASATADDAVAAGARHAHATTHVRICA